MTAQATLDNIGALLLKPEQAAAVLNIGRTMLFDLVKTKQLHSVQVGRLRRFRLADLKRYTDELGTEGES